MNSLRSEAQVLALRTKNLKKQTGMKPTETCICRFCLFSRSKKIASQFEKNALEADVGVERILLIMKRSLSILTLCSTFLSFLAPYAVIAAPPRTPDKTVNCDILVVGGGLSGAATAYEGLLAGQTVCLSEITDWLGGQISSQGTSALDERPTQRRNLFYSRGYLELRNQIERKYRGNRNPGDCWVSDSCFLPRDGHEILTSMLKDAERKGRGRLQWFPNTVIKELEYSGDGKIISSAIAIQHQPAKGTPPSQHLSFISNHRRRLQLRKLVSLYQNHCPLCPKQTKGKASRNAPNWYVVDTSETGEIIGLADVRTDWVLMLVLT
jgi:hypothetical protein